jgi:hypothetical protein
MGHSKAHHNRSCQEADKATNQSVQLQITPTKIVEAQVTAVQAIKPALTASACAQFNRIHVELWDYKDKSLPYRRVRAKHVCTYRP